MLEFMYFFFPSLETGHSRNTPGKTTPVKNFFYMQKAITTL